MRVPDRISSTARARRARRPRAIAAFGALGVAGIFAAGASSCSAAPPAAIVNGQAISEQQLSQQLEWWSSSRAFVSEQDASFLQQAEQAAAQGQQEAPITIEGSGTGPGVYNSNWAAMELSNLVEAAAIQQYLARSGHSPSRAELAAAWASEYAMDPRVWVQLAAGARDQAALEVADRALIDGQPANSSGDSSFYAAHRSYFWSQVCVVSADVSVPGPGGGVDMASSKRQAEALATQLSAQGAAGAGAVPGGARYCMSPEQLIEQPADFRDEVGSLAPGQAAALRQGYGYQVVSVTSRANIQFSAQVSPDIDEVIAHGGAQQGEMITGDTKVSAILKAAKVEVNSAYGTWQPNVPPPYQPQVLAPGRSA